MRRGAAGNRGAGAALSKIMRPLPPRVGMIATCLAAGVLAAACASTAPESVLGGGRWTVASIGGAAVSTRAPTIEFAGGRIAGSGGCNRFFGGYETRGDELTVSGLGATEMACEEPVMRQEAVFFAALNDVTGFRRDGDVLVLAALGDRDIVLRRAG